jgi:hypothetical protein
MCYWVRSDATVALYTYESVDRGRTKKETKKGQLYNFCENLVTNEKRTVLYELHCHRAKMTCSVAGP